MNNLEVKSSQGGKNEDITEGEDLIRLTVQRREEVCKPQGREKCNLGLRKVVDQPSWT